MDSLFFFIGKQCAKYNIDESHGLKHAIGTCLRAYELIQALSVKLTKKEQRVALYAAALHDMCDSKYTDVTIATEDIRRFLLGEGWSINDIETLVDIITTMSYSKLKRSQVDAQIRYPDHGEWQIVYHIVRHADLLEGYIVARCFLYNKHIFPEKSHDEHWWRAREIFQERVFKYVSDGWIFLPEALPMASLLESHARNCFLHKSLDWPNPSMDLLRKGFQ